MFQLPSSLNQVGRHLPKNGYEYQAPLTKEEKIAAIKKKYNLHHGKGKRKKKRR